MSIANALKSLFTGADETRELPTDVVSSIYQNQFSGLWDPEHVHAPDFASAYRSMSAMLMRFRSNNFAPFLQNARVEASADGGESYEYVGPEHPYQMLANAPNPFMDALEFWTFTCLNRDGVGHADFMVDSVDVTLRGARVRVPVGLYPIYPSYGYMTPLIDGRGAVKGWRYHKADGSQPVLEPTDVMRLKRVHPVSSWRTAGLIEANAYEIDAEAAGNIYGRDTLRDGGIPQVVLETDQTVTQANVSKYRKIARDFARQYRRGVRDAVPISHGGLSVKELNMLGGADIVQVREFFRKTLWHVWEIHEGLFAKDATRANAEGAFYMFSLLTTKPNVESMAANFIAELNRIFAASLPDDGLLYRFNPGVVVPVDQAQQSEIDARQVSSGLRTINELRARDGLAPVDGGDAPLVSASMITLQSAMLTGL